MKHTLCEPYCKILSFLLLILGFGSCEGGLGGGFADEYGCPHATYKVNGRVVDAENTKNIQGIQVVFTYPDQNGEPEQWGDTVFTDKTGAFKIETSNVIYEDWFLIFEDIDGEENGLYTKKEEKIEVHPEDYKGGGKSWYKGEVDIDMGTVKLTPREPDEPENE